MELNKKNYSEESNLKISEDVIATIAMTTVKDVPGVHSMAPNITKDVKRLLGKKGEGNGISITFENGDAVVEADIIVKFGVKVNEVATTVQSRVKEAVETMTGITVKKVDVVVAGMKLETENKGKKSK